MERKDWQTAYDVLNRAWKKQPTGEVAGVLGQTERKLGKCAAAIEHLTFALNEPAPDREPDALVRVSEWIEDCKQRVSRLVVACSRDGAEIVIDGNSVGISPLQREVLVDPGDHNVEARSRGIVISRATLTAEAGREHKLELLAAPEAPTRPISTPPRPTESGTKDDSERPSFVPAYLGGGVALAAGM